MRSGGRAWNAECGVGGAECGVVAPGVDWLVLSVKWMTRCAECGMVWCLHKGFRDQLMVKIVRV